MDQNSQSRAEWLHNNLLEDNQLASLVPSGKIGHCIRRIIDHDDDGWWRGLLLKHVNGLLLDNVPIIYISGEKTSASGDSLGIYFGGKRCPLGANLTKSYALDMDDGRLLDEAMKAFPEMAFFQKTGGAGHTQGSWHAHGRVGAPVDARALKAWVTSRMPFQLLGQVEVFPKTADKGDADIGNYIRLPMNPVHCRYEPVSDLKPIIPVDSSIIPLWTAPVTISFSSCENMPAGDIPSGDTVSEPKPSQDDENTGTHEDEEHRRALEDLLSDSRTSFLGEYIAGHVLDGRRNSQSEFDWRLISKLIKLGHRGPAFLDYCIRYRNPGKAGPEALHYREQTVTKALSRKTVREQHFNFPVPLTGQKDFTQTWLYNSPIWGHFMLGRACRDAFLKHFQFAQDRLSWNMKGWSPVYFLSARTLVDLKCGTIQTVLRSQRKLKALGLIRLVKAGKGKAASKFRCRLPNPEEEQFLMAALRMIKEQEIDLGKERGFKEARCLIREHFPVLMATEDVSEVQGAVEEGQGQADKEDKCA